MSTNQNLLSLDQSQHQSQQATQRAATILLLEEDDEVRPLLKQALHRQGYRVILAIDQEDALERAEAGCDCFDLILIDQIKRSLHECLLLGRKIRQNAKVSVSTPIIVMAECCEPEMEGKDVKLSDNEYATYLGDVEQLTNLLQRLCFV